MQTSSNNKQYSNQILSKTIIYSSININSNNQLKQKCKIKQNKKIGQWTQKQSLKYYLFIYHHKLKFITKTQRKSNKIFKKMSKFIRTRTSIQCRTHHQNIIKRFNNVQKALQNYLDFNPIFYRKYNLAKVIFNALEQQEFLEDNCKVIKQCQPCQPILSQLKQGNHLQKKQNGKQDKNDANGKNDKNDTNDKNYKKDNQIIIEHISNTSNTDKSDKQVKLQTEIRSPTYLEDSVQKNQGLHQEMIKKAFTLSFQGFNIPNYIDQTNKNQGIDIKNITSNFTQLNYLQNPYTLNNQFQIYPNNTNPYSIDSYPIHKHVQYYHNTAINCNPNYYNNLQECHRLFVKWLTKLQQVHNMR